MTVGQTYTIAGAAENGLTANGVPALQAAVSPLSLASESSGAVVIGEGLDVRVVPQATGSYYGQTMAAGDIYTIAGDDLTYSGGGGPATAAVLPRPSDAAADPAGNILTVSEGMVSVVAKQTGTFYGQSMTKGDIYTVYKSTRAASSPYLYQVAVDASGNLLFCALYGHQEHVTVLAEHTGTYYGVAMTAGSLYTVYVDNINENDPLNAVWPDRQGNLLITRYFGVYVLAGHSGLVYGHYLSAGHSMLVAGGRGSATENGIPATQASLPRTEDTVEDPQGNLLIVNADNGIIRVVAPKTGTFYGQRMNAGDIYTIAGTGKNGSLENAIPALSAALTTPQGVAVDSSGNIVIADTGHNQVRVVATKTGSFYGQSMKAGDIYLLAGTGKDAFGGDGGLASKAWLPAPGAVTILSDGSLVVPSDNRLRLITP
jgi:hypothetical protein